MYKKILSEEELIAQSKEKEIFYRYFEQIASWREGVDKYTELVYAKDTKVKYLIMHGKYANGIAPLYNADGTLQIYDGE